METVADADHAALAEKLRRLMARHREVQLLLRMGEYRRGADAEVDRAVALAAPLQDLLRQSMDTSASIADTVARMRELLERGNG